MPEPSARIFPEPGVSGIVRGDKYGISGICSCRLEVHFTI
jgi:hypothetical protein